MGGPSAHTMLAQRGTRVLTHELEGELKRKAEVQKEKSERWEKKRQEKAFNEVILNSSRGLLFKNFLSST